MRIFTERKERVTIIQPNITQQMRWDRDSVMQIYDRMMVLTNDAVATKPELILWPESTVPLTLLANDFYRDSMENFSRTSGADIILGSVAEDDTDPTKIWNSAYLVSAGKTSGRYDKIHLVPYGEYVPMRKFLFFAKKLVREVGQFQFGENDKPLRGKHAWGPAICYEVVFPALVATQVRNGADVLVTITNDAWFDVSAAPRQHLDSARLRAIETNRWMLRAATTGISAIVDPTGQIVAKLDLNREGLITGEFGARQTMTPYVRFGNWFAWIALVATALLVIARRKARQE
jgi:apolipoprotein N-acyltransferase